MTTIRMTIMQALVARIDAITGWSAALRGTSNDIDAAVFGIVYPVSEDKQLANSAEYDATLRVEVAIIVRTEDVTDQQEFNPYIMLDERVAQVEQVVHAPDSWGISPAFTDVVVTGHTVEDPTEENELMARVFITFRYRHDYQNPSQ